MQKADKITIYTQAPNPLNTFIGNTIEFRNE